MLPEIWSDLRHRLRALVNRNAVERELDDELRFHLDREIDKHMRQGLARSAAERLAHLEFGGVNRIKDDARDARGVAVLEHLAQDARYALRSLRLRPMFSAGVILTLALGVGVNAAMFGVIDRLLFRSPAYLIHPETVNRVYFEWARPDGARRADAATEYKRFTDIARDNSTLSDLAAFAYRSMAVGVGDDTRFRVIGILSGNFFGFYSAKPAIGRLFEASDDAPSREPIAVLAYGYWQSAFGGSPNVLGRRLMIGQQQYTIVGVAPRGFEGMAEERAPAAFVPVTIFAHRNNATFAENYSWSWLELLARRKPGVTMTQASADLGHAFLMSWNAERGTDSYLADASVVKPRVILGPTQIARGPLAGPQTKVVGWIGGVAVIVLLIACANVANLLLARSLRRRREIAVRRAIGGTRWRLSQQILVEVLVLSTLGAAFGLVGAGFVSSALRSQLLGVAESPRVATDPRTIAFAAMLAAATAVVAGLVPAIDAGRGDLGTALRAGTREGAYRRSRIRGGLLVAQTALSVVLLVGAGLFIRSLQAVRALPLGYDVEHVAYAEASMRDVHLDSASERTLSQRLLEQVRAVPGVLDAAQIVSVPFYSEESRGFKVAGVDSVKRLGRFLLQAGTPDYFATTGTRILRGRAFGAADREHMPRVMIVSEAMARVLWKNADPVGKCVRFRSDTAPCTTVVGVAENVRVRNVTGDADFTYYVPLAQYMEQFGSPPMIAFFARTRGPAEGDSEALRYALQRVMPGNSFITVRPLHEIIDPTTRSWMSGARMFTAFGVLALALAAIGLYAVIAFSVAQRTQELGVRIALGARVADVVRLIVLEGSRVTVAGTILGAGIAWIASGSLRDLLFGVSPHDPVIYAGVAAMLLIVGALASALPAARAARVDPNQALRTE
jgi:predicted permease